MLNQSSSPFSIFQMFSDCRPFSIGLLVSILMALFSAQFAIAGSYESAELTSSELQSGKRMSPYVSYQPWSYMKRAPAAPIIRFGKRSSHSVEWREQQPRNTRAVALSNPLIRFGKRVPSNAPLIRFGRRDAGPLIRFGKRSPAGGAPLIRFGRSWENEEDWTNEGEERK